MNSKMFVYFGVEDILEGGERGAEYLPILRAEIQAWVLFECPLLKYVEF